MEFLAGIYVGGLIANSIVMVNEDNYDEAPFRFLIGLVGWPITMFIREHCKMKSKN